MNYLKIRNWETWQSYRSDRGQPPWIKLHRVLLRNAEWGSLTDAQKGQLVSIWMLAADKDGKIPDDAAVIRKFCCLDKNPDLELFVQLEFIERDAKVTPTRRQVDAKVTTQSQSHKQNAYTEERREESTGKPVAVPPYRNIIENLNQQLGKNYELEPVSEMYKRLIRARWKQGFREDDFAKCVEIKKEKWSGDDKMDQCLRPQTLFSGNMESYLQEGGDSIRDELREEFENG